jgi:hypothetical protein
LGYSIIFTYIVLLFDGYFQFFFNKNILFFELQKYNEHSFYVTSFFNEEKKLGSFLAKMFPLFLFSIILFRDNFKKIKLEKLFSLIIILIFLLLF